MKDGGEAVMTGEKPVLVLRNAHVIDPSQGINDAADVVVAADGKVAAIGKNAGDSVDQKAARIDLSGRYLSPGWIDIHIHAYGMLGFADPDSIGIHQGVTTFVDAGGPGIGVMDEFSALFEGQTITDLYAGPYIRPMGIIGAQYIEGEMRSLMSFPVADWIDFMKEKPGLVRYLKVAALGSYGTGPLKMAKGQSEIIGVPLYGHIGEYQQQQVDPSVYEIFNISQAGDIITHLYHANDGAVLDDDGRVLPVVRDAERRGVLFDVGFGAFNFDWDLAETCFTQDLRPHIISSDLQQFNVISPAFSLANIMGMFLHLGMTSAEVIDAVTWAPAKALSLTDKGGSLKPGMPADVTVFDLEEGAFDTLDTFDKTRVVNRRFVPSMVFKNGVEHEIDMTRCQDDKNWLLQFAEDHVPEAARHLSGVQRDFLGALADSLRPVSWHYSIENMDLDKAVELQGVFRDAVRRTGIDLRMALLAIFACFLDSGFTMQSGLFLLQIEKGFALERLREVAGLHQAAA